MPTKIKIYQADDNDQIENGINKFHNVIDALLVFLNIKKHQFTEEISTEITITNYDKALEKINTYVTFDTSSDINKSDSDIDKVLNHLENEKYDIYIIDLKWGDNSDGGLKIIESIKRKTSPENIIIYSQHDKIARKNLQRKIYNPNIQHIDTEDIEVDLPKILTKGIKNIREKIILNCNEEQKNKIRYAILNYDYDHFIGFLCFENKNYLYKDLYVGQKLTVEEILNDINGFIDTNNFNIDFVGTSDMEKIKNTYVKQFVTKVSLNKEVNNLLDFASLNLFIRIYMQMINDKDYSEKSYVIDQIYISKYCPNTDKNIYNPLEWDKFYIKLIVRRVVMLWSNLFNDLDENVKSFHSYHDKFKKLNKYELIGLILFYAESKPKKINSAYEKHLINRDLGFKKISLENFNPKYFISGELNFVNTFTLEKINLIIQAIKDINSERKNYRGYYNRLSFNLWDLKTSFFEIFEDTEINEKFNNSVLLEIEDLNISENIKDIFFNEEIKTINELIFKITSITKRIE